MPVGPLLNAIDFADSKVFLNASTEPISGFGALARTATPMPERRMSRRKPVGTFPVLTRRSSVSVYAIARSIGGPASISWVHTGVDLYVIAILCPLACSNSGMIASRAGWTLGELTIVISAALTPYATITALRHPAIAAAGIFFSAVMVFSMNSWLPWKLRH